MNYLWCLLLLGLAVAASGQGVLTPSTFDDDSLVDHALIPNGYGGLQWENFFIQNGANSPGFAVGAVSSPNVGFNGLGNPASISSVSPFTLHSAHLTAVYVDTSQIRVQGFIGETLLYDNTYTLNNAAPMLVNFGYVGIDQVRFSITTSPTGIFAMDNLVAVPEPSAGALLYTGAALWLYMVLLTRKKAAEIE